MAKVTIDIVTTGAAQATAQFESVGGALRNVFEIATGVSLGNIFETAVRGAVDFTKELVTLGLETKRVETSFSALASAVGANSASIKASLDAVGEGLIDVTDVLPGVGRLLAAGFDSTAINQLASDAKNMSVIMGTDVTTALNAMSEAVLRSSEKSLGAAAGLVKYEELLDATAAAAGRSVSEFTEYGKQQVLLQAIHDATVTTFGNVTNAIDEQQQHLQQSQVAWKNFKEGLAVGLVDALGGVVLAFQNAEKGIQRFFENAAKWRGTGNLLMPNVATEVAAVEVIADAGRKVESLGVVAAVAAPKMHNLFKPEDTSKAAAAMAKAAEELGKIDAALNAIAGDIDFAIMEAGWKRQEDLLEANLKKLVEIDAALEAITGDIDFAIMEAGWKRQEDQLEAVRKKAEEVDALLEAIGGDIDFAIMEAGWKRQEDSLNAAATAAEAYETSLAVIGPLTAVLGADFDGAGTRIAAMRGELERLARQTPGEVTPAMEEIGAAIRTALADQKLSRDIEQMFLSVTDTFTKMANGLIAGTLDIGQAFADLGQSLLTNFVQLVIHQVFDPILEAAAAFVVDFARTLLGGGGGGGGWGQVAGSFVGGLFGGGVGAGSAAAGLAGDLAFANAPGGLGLGGGGGGGAGGIAGSVLSVVSTAYDLGAAFGLLPSKLSLLTQGATAIGEAIGLLTPSLVEVGIGMPLAAEAGTTAMTGLGVATEGLSGLMSGLGPTLAYLSQFSGPLAVLTLPLLFGALDAPDPETIWKNVQRERAAAGYTGDLLTRQAALAAGTLTLQEPNVRMDLAIAGGMAQLHLSALEAQLADGLAVGMEDVYRTQIGNMKTFLDQLAAIGIAPATGDLTQFGANIQNVGEAISLEFRDQIIAEYSRILKSISEAAPGAAGADAGAAGVDREAARLAAALTMVKVNFVTTVNAMKDLSDSLGLAVDRSHISLTDIQGSTESEMQAFATNFQTQMVDAMMDAPPLTWAKMAGLFDLKGLQKGSETFEETAQRVGLALGSLRQMMLDLEKASQGPMTVSEALAETLTSIGEGMALASANLRSGDPSDTLLAAAQMLELIKAKWQAMTEAIQIAAAEVNTLTASLAAGAQSIANWAVGLSMVGISIDGAAAAMTALVQTVPTVEGKLTALGGATSLYGAQLQIAAPQGSAAVIAMAPEATALLGSFQSALDAILTIEDPAQRMAALTNLLDQFGATVTATTDAVRTAYAAEIAAVTALVDAINTYASQIAAAGSAIASNAGWLAKAGVDIGTMASDMAAFSLTIPTVTGKLTTLGSAVDLFGASLQVGQGPMDVAGATSLIGAFEAGRAAGADVGGLLAQINTGLAGIPAGLADAFSAAMLIQDPGQRLAALTGVLTTLGNLLGSLPPEVADALASAFGPEIQFLVTSIQTAAREQAAAAVAASTQLTNLIKSSGALTAENFIVQKIGEMNEILGLIATGAGKFATDLATALGEAGGDISDALSTASGELATVLGTLSTAVGELATAENAMALAARGMQLDMGALGATIGSAMQSAVLAALQAHFPSPGGLPSAAMPTAQHGLDFVLGGLTRLHLGEMVLNPRAAEMARAMGITNAAMTNWPMMGARGREVVARARDVIMPHLRGGGDGAMAPLSIPITINISGSSGRAAEPLAKQIIELVTQEIRYGSIGRAIDKRRRGEQ